jgi:oleandomycin transport system permease protein
MMTTGVLMGFELTNGIVPALAALALCMGFALCFGWISVFVGMIARTSGAVQGIMFLLVLPLSFGSNTFVPTSTMPGWLQAFVDVNPLTHLIGAERALLGGAPMGAHLLWTFAWMAGLLAVFVPLALRAYGRRL